MLHAAHNTILRNDVITDVDLDVPEADQSRNSRNAVFFQECRL